MKTLLNKLKKENLEKLENNKTAYEYSVVRCYNFLAKKHYWFELQVDEAMLILSMTTDKNCDVLNLTELFEKS